MKKCAILLSVVPMILILALMGCGNESSTPSPSPSSVSVAIAASPTHLGASETYQFTAVVTNTSDTSVIWSVSGCASACGAISASGLYTAPSFVANAANVTINATSRADTRSSASSTLVLMPVSVSVAPNTPANVLPRGTRDFTATLDHDPKNAGVIWALSGAGCSGNSCGTLMNVTGTSVVYQAPEIEPSPHTVRLTASSITDRNQKAYVTFTVSITPYMLEGKYAFLINGWSDKMRDATAGQLNADGRGNFTGVWDVNRGAGPIVAQPIRGFYNIQPDGHGTMTVLTPSAATWNYIITVDDSGATARFAESNIPPSSASGGSSGYMTRQDENYFNLSSLKGDRVIALFGEATGSHVAALGRFTSDGAGTLNNGVMDLSWEINENVAKFPNTVVLTGTFGPPDPVTGRGTASLKVAAGATATYNFAYYIISDSGVLLVQTDVRGFISGLLIPVLSGEVRHQKNAGSFVNASLNAPTVVHVTDATWHQPFVDEPMIRVGQMVPNGSGSLTFTFDENGGSTIKSSMTATGPYSISPNGRASWNIPGNAIAYLIDQNNGYVMTQDGDGAGFGAFEPQTGEPFSSDSLAGEFLLNTGPPAMEGVENDAGWMTLAKDGMATATLYINTGSGSTQYSFTGPATVAANGRGTVVLNTTPPSAPQEIVFWAISPSRAVAILTVNTDDTSPALLELRRTAQ